MKTSPPSESSPRTASPGAPKAHRVANSSSNNSRSPSPTHHHHSSHHTGGEEEDGHSPSKLELAELKLQSINEKLIEIRRLRRERSPEGPISPLERARRKRIELEGHQRPKSSRLSHPHLTYMLAELAHSPYLTSPLKKYSQETLELSGELS